MKISIRKENLKKIGRKAKWILRKAIFAIVFVEAFVFLLICELILCSQASFHDFFTTGKVSEFNNRPPNITKNIVVDAIDMENGGIKYVMEIIINEVAKKRPNWFFTVLHDFTKDAALKFNNPNIKIINISNCSSNYLIIMRNILNYLSFGLFYDQITQLLFWNRIVFNNRNCNLLFDPCSNMSINDFSVPKLSIIHDIEPIDLAKFQNQKNESRYVSWRKTVTNMVLNSSKKIVTVSNFTRNRLVDIYKLKSDFISTIYTKLRNRINKENQISEKQINRTLEKFSLKQKNYVIYASIVRHYKNHERLIQAFGQFIKKNDDAKLKLVIVGTVENKTIEKLYNALKIICDSAEQYEYLKNRIVFTNFIPDEELSILLSNALAMIFPSLYEGFGMPVIEAMSAGIPVACSNVTSLPEVVGDAALLFDPYNVDDIEKAIEKITGDEKLREDLIKRGYKRAEIFSDTDSMIDEYIKVFEECMSK